MVSRSLIVKIYAYALLVFVLSLGLSFGLGRALVEQTRFDVWQAVGRDVARFVGREVERSYAGGRPDPARLDELSKALHLELEVLPWRDADPRAIALSRDPVRFERADGHGPWGQRVYVRLAVDGRAVGILGGRLERPGHHEPRVGVWFALLPLGLLALMIVPPLVLWVVRPLRRMAQVAHRLGQGDLATPVAVDRRDEFGELQRAFERMREQLQEMLTSRERLLRDISHELRAPLSRMAVAASLLRAGPDPAALDQLERDVAAMDALLGELLALARGRTPGALAKAPLDLAELADAALAERSLVLAGRGLELTRLLAPAPVLGDRALLLRAIGNMLDNAIKYTPDPGRLHVETVMEGDRAVLRIADSGPGVAAEHLPRIFDPFYRPDDSRSRETGGTGLGLAIVQAIAEGHGGRAELGPAPEGGALVTLSLPARL